MKKVLLPSMLGSFGVGSCAGLGKTCKTPIREQTEILSIEMGRSCSLACRHCIYKGKGGEKPDIEMQESIVAALDNGLAPQWISISGKEPTFFPETLVPMTKKLKRSGAHLILMSNGVLIDEALASNLIDHVDSFDISLDGDRAAHEWMRGPGTYDRAKNAINILLARKARLIGIISTAVNSVLPDGRQQMDSIVALAQELDREYGHCGKVSLSISLYYGPPGDPFLLGAGQISGLINRLHLLNLSILVLISAHYSHLWRDVAGGVNFTLPETSYDSELAMPILDADNLRILVPNQAASQLAVYRVANDGQVYMGCNHLSWDEACSRPYSLGDMHSTPLEGIIQRFRDGTDHKSNMLSTTCTTCLECPDWTTCQGGDKISGLYCQGIGQDPYCNKLNTRH